MSSKTNTSLCNCSVTASSAFAVSIYFSWFERNGSLSFDLGNASRTRLEVFEIVHRNGQKRKIECLFECEIVLYDILHENADATFQRNVIQLYFIHSATTSISISSSSLEPSALHKSSASSSSLVAFVVSSPVPFPFVCRLVFFSAFNLVSRVCRHFMRRFWNHTLTCTRIDPENRKKRRKQWLYRIFSWLRDHGQTWIIE